MIQTDVVLSDAGVKKPTKEINKAMQEIAWLAWKEAAFKNYPQYNEKFERMNFISWFHLTMEDCE